MKYIFKISKVKGNEYLQIFKGNSTFDMTYIRSAGSAAKLVKALERLDELLELTNKYPELLTNFQEQKKANLTNSTIKHKMPSLIIKKVG